MGKIYGLYRLNSKIHLERGPIYGFENDLVQTVIKLYFELDRVLFPRLGPINLYIPKGGIMPYKVVEFQWRCCWAIGVMLPIASTL